MEEIVPSPGELYFERREQLANTESEEEAREIIKPIIGSLVVFEEADAISGEPEPLLRAVADKAPLTEQEVIEKYRSERDEFQAIVSAEAEEGTEAVTA